MTTKSNLKRARDALARQDYNSARDASMQVLEYEADNYNANVFLGLALLELGDSVKSEQAYRAAINSQPDQPLAWQGIVKLYEKREEWEKCAESLTSLMMIFSNAANAMKCGETLEKLLSLRRSHGTPGQLVKTLSLLLPDSAVYRTLSELPPPDPTSPIATTVIATQTAVYDSLPIIEEIIRIVEIDEAEKMRKEIEKRRTRLNAPSIDKLTDEVGCEIWEKSLLPKFYSEIINHPTTTDALRRETESKLLHFKQRLLYALPDTQEWSPQKSLIRKEVDELIDGIVLLKLPNESAWMAFFNRIDAESISGYDEKALRTYVTLFPEAPLTGLLHGYCAYLGLPWYGIKEGDTSDDGKVGTLALLSEEDAFDAVLSNFSRLRRSLIAHRVLVDVYLTDSDYENAIKSTETALKVLLQEESRVGRTFPKLRMGFKASRATSFVHFFPPKHHPEAIPLIEEVLSVDPNNISSLLGQGYIWQAANQWQDAAAVFDKVASLLPGDPDEGLRAVEESAWCQFQLSRSEGPVVVLRNVLDRLQKLDDRALDTARCLWRIGLCYWNIGGENREQAYRYYITSLKSNPAFAPAFSALGIYYSEFSSPPDLVRASKCFQKAFELDPREVDAARRLAHGFANENEWDLVEVVARRTIEGEGGLNAGLGETRYLPINSWAWKALGVVEFNSRNYLKSIEAFQVALRAEPEDQVVWVRLGEAYSKAGRHAAALKALRHARDLAPNDWICLYFISEVYNKMGLFHDAIATLESILLQRPLEIGVLCSLAQSYLDAGRMELAEGFYSRAEVSLVASINTAMKTIMEFPGFRGVSWKTVADSIFLLSKRSTLINDQEVRAGLDNVIPLLSAHSSDRLVGILSSPLSNDGTMSGAKLREIAVTAYDYRIALGGADDTTKSSLWFDLGVVLHSCANYFTPGSSQGSLTVGRAIDCLKNAIRGEPNNASYWSALGDAYFLSKARSAQHAYIRALECDSKDTFAWTRLGLLYLHYEDLELANQAFHRAQILDTEYSLAWVGQALVATANGHETDAKALLEHAVSLVEPVPTADLEYASRTFDGNKVVGYGHQLHLDKMLPAFFVLSRYCEGHPTDSSALHLLGLICESLGQLNAAIDQIQRAIAILEAVYEEAEDAETERRFTVATINLARLYLCTEEYQNAIDSFSSAVGLLGDAETAESQSLRARAEIGLGLANYALGGHEASILHLQAAVEYAGADIVIRDQAVVLLSQVMWSVGTDEFKESAQQQLLNCITANPENLTAINALAGMGILMHDDTLVDAALSEILTLPPDRRNELDPSRDVNHLLLQHQLSQGDTRGALSVAQAAVVREPTRVEARNALATLSLQQNQTATALALVSATEGIQAHDPSTLVDSLGIQAFALLKAGGDRRLDGLRKSQQMVMLAPSQLRNWQMLGLATSDL